MSADISAARGVSAPETSEALWATDGLDLSTDESYAAGSVARAQWHDTATVLARIFRSLYLHHYTGSAPARAVGSLPPDPAAFTSCERKLQMSINPDAAEERTHVRPSAERALWRMAGPWWLFLLTGLAWLIIALVVLRFTTTSITTVGVLIGVLFLLGALNEFMISAIRPTWRWAHILLGILFVAGAIWAFARPFDAFWSLE